MHIPSLITAGLFALVLAGCQSSGSFGVEQPCATHEDCAEGYCEHGLCVLGDVPDASDDTGSGEVPDTDDRRPDLSDDDVPLTDTDERDDVDGTPSAGELGALCTTPEACASGMCLWTGGDRTCVASCDDGCPEETVCGLVRGERGEPLRACVHVNVLDCEDADRDGYGEGDMCLGPDCDDESDVTNLDAEEVCDDIDNDCDGEIDEEVTFVNVCGGCRLLEGELGDACGICDTGRLACDGEETLVCEGEDPEAAEATNACGGCAALELEPGEPCGACDDGLVVCADPETVICEGSRPPPPETCDGEDNDCDGEIDEENPDGGAACATGELGGCADGAMTCVDAGLTCLPLTPAVAEFCDGIDNDCDGLTDEDVLGTFFQDLDGDGAGNPNVVLRACTAPPGYVRNADDCNDARPDILAGECAPGATRSSDCGRCGTQAEICTLSCQWGQRRGVYRPGRVHAWHRELRRLHDVSDHHLQ